jgi:anti-sigma regulatory factor (Ser/Thr protein kinase)
MRSSYSNSTIEECWPNDVQAPRRARRALTHFAGSGLDEDQLAAALLLATEMVTNVVQHTTGPLTLRATLDKRALVVEVEDYSADGLQLAKPSDHDESGRGLQIIDAIASRWGTTRTTCGKRVWFEIPCRDT